MITLNLERHRDGQRLSQGVRQETPAEALSFLVRSELAFGASILDMTETHLHLETRLCDMVDVTYIDGSAEDMRTLVDMVVFYQLACNREDLAHGGAASEYCRLISRNAAYSGVILNLGAPIFVGRSRLRIAVMLAHGYRDESDLALAASLSLEDLMALLSMLADYPQMNFRTLAESLGFCVSN